MEGSTFSQPVATPAHAPVNVQDIRDILNPRPKEGAPVAAWIEHGYLDAMLDACLFDVYKVEGQIDFYSFPYIVRDLLEYQGCEQWMGMDWGNGAQHLQDLADEMMEVYPEVWSGSDF